MATRRQAKAKAKAVVKQVIDSDSEEEGEESEDSSEDGEEVQKSKGKPKPKAKAKAKPKAAAKKGAKQAVESDSEDEPNNEDESSEEEEAPKPKAKAKAKAKATAKRAAKQVESDSEEQSNSSSEEEEEEPKPKPKAKAKAKAVAKKAATQVAVETVTLEEQGTRGARKVLEDTGHLPPSSTSDAVQSADLHGGAAGAGAVHGPRAVMPTSAGNTREASTGHCHLDGPILEADDWMVCVMEFNDHIRRHQGNTARSESSDPLLKALNAGLSQTGHELLLKLVVEYEGRCRHIRLVEEVKHREELLLIPSKNAAASVGSPRPNTTPATRDLTTGAPEAVALESVGDKTFAKLPAEEMIPDSLVAAPTASALLPSHIRASDPALAWLEEETLALEALLSPLRLGGDVPDLSVLSALGNHPPGDGTTPDAAPEDGGSSQRDWHQSHLVLREEALRRRDEFAWLKERLAGHAASLALSSLPL